MTDRLIGSWSAGGRVSTPGSRTRGQGRSLGVGVSGRETPGTLPSWSGAPQEL